MTSRQSPSVIDTAQTYDLSLAVQAAKLSALSYLSPADIASELTEIGWQPLQRIGLDEAGGRFGRPEFIGGDSYAFAAKKNDGYGGVTYAIAFRGTESPLDHVST